MTHASDAAKTVRIGIVGFGTAGRAFVPAIAKHSGFFFAGFADPSSSVRERGAREFGVAAYESIDALIERGALDAVYVASPTTLHRAHVELAARAGKHVLVEKPMAATLDDARAMVAAADAAGIVLLAGHSHSYDQPIHAMRALIDSGELGRVRMVHTWCFSDWIYRPRRPDELDASQGGGVTLRQGSHQFDIIRLLAGGAARSVRAKTFDWDPERRAIGAHTVFIEFDDGAAATAVYNGYGRFASAELCFDIGEWGFPAQSRAMAKPASVEDELRAKAERAHNAIPASAPNQPFFGLTLVSCERGEMRQSPKGLLVYTRDGKREIQLPTNVSPRELVMREFHDAISGRKRAVHDGKWGLANLEVCAAAIASSERGEEVFLEHQVALERRA
ncbi:oxidoreductase domain-containing protein [Caballeronia fortuita]|uniref:Oxidoreductase domain-containing protein n=1 Tax=Caballeronia fortuita TaxID=1777138 RepID=A0A158A9Y0_9BURK|nr:Gfo/Idh/MocA family oxidoreductase [Caballeronia fortuita]SAK54560.1 oxidoreductase domain-containing protein [Caballeronia fortuita]